MNRLIGRWLALADSEHYPRVLATWFVVFCVGFFVLPGAWTQRVLFYGGLPITLPGVAAVARPLLASPLARAMGAFLLFSALSALWSDKWLTVGDQTRKAACIAYFLAVCCAVGSGGTEQWRWIFQRVQVLAAIAAILMAAFFLWDGTGEARFVGYGRFANSNYTAAVTGTIALLGLTSMPRMAKRGSLLLLACQAPIAFLLVLTGSRAALFAYICGVLIATGLMWRRRSAEAGAAGPAWPGILAAVACIGVIGAAAAWRGQAWMAAEIGRGDTYRLEIWAANLSRISLHPWFGYGATTPDPFIAHDMVLGYHAHNLFLAQAFYGGVFGLALWLSVFVLAARAAFLAWREGGDVMPLVALWFLFAVGMVDIGPVVVDMQAIWAYVWITLGIVLSCDFVRRSSRGNLGPGKVRYLKSVESLGTGQRVTAP